MMTVDIIEYLLSASAKVQTVGRTKRCEIKDQNLSKFLESLSGIVFNNSSKPVFKNSFDQLVQQWDAIDDQLKSQIKESVVNTLGSSKKEVSHTAAHVVAKIATIEIPQKKWPGLVEKLLANLTLEDASPSLKQAILETLGFLCEEISSEDFQNHEVNNILTAVVKEMKTNLEAEVRLAATRALCNTIGLAPINRENEIERNKTMRAICGAASAKERTEIRQAAFKCLDSIASTSYDVLEPYMSAIMKLASTALKGDEAVGLQALEFWNSICHKELEISSLRIKDASVQHFQFIQRALHLLLPVLLETLLKKDVIDNLALAGGRCLCLVARTVGNSILRPVMRFVDKNCEKSDWEYREAAIHAFGAILEGPSLYKLSFYVDDMLDILLKAMNDRSRYVRETTAWTLSRIFECFLYSVTAEDHKKIVGILLKSLKDAPQVSINVCRAIYFLANRCESAGKSSSQLTPHMQDILSSLITTAERTNVSDPKLRSSAYETFNEVVRCSDPSKTFQNIIAKLLPNIISELDQTLNFKTVLSDDRVKQASLFGVLHVIIQKLSSADKTKSIMSEVADKILSLCLRCFHCRSSTVHEEAMFAIGALAYATGLGFEKHMPKFYKYLRAGLQNVQEYQFCAISVGVVGDICRALEEKILPFCPDIMEHLFKDLSSGELHLSVKPPILACFGDVALAISGHFEIYIERVMQSLEVCAQMDNNDNDIDYENQLRCSILKAYSGIFQGCKKSKAEAKLLPLYVPQFLKFIELVVNDKNRDDEATEAAVLVLGEMADALRMNVKTKDRKTFMNLLKRLQPDSEQLMESAFFMERWFFLVMASNLASIISTSINPPLVQWLFTLFEKKKLQIIT